ncbi:2Fe-2S iron-sulfur cluster-binding protein [Nocardioides zeae]|uniref:Oxidoreductase n=1 Tax=Nocardioides zeae TaxID=1457234 RepID=A0A6P0HGX6_9ACTN|nr:oxidoreductase [Nocardioides zeae]
MSDRRRLRVVARTEVADGVVRLDLGPEEGGAPLPTWSPGAHLDLHLADGLVRQYSLCGDPDDPERLSVAVLREADGRGGSEHVHTRLAAGDTVEVGGPRNHFELVDAASYVFVAGGIGITPIVPMLRAAEERGVPWVLVYGGRSRASMAFAEDLVAAYGADRVRLRPADEHGLLDLPAELGDVVPGRAVYCCGPGPLLDAVERVVGERDGEQLHLERFAPTGDVDTTGEAFEVELARTGTTLEVGPDESVLEALEDAGIAVESSCREGTCGTCETAVRGGVPEHRDAILTPEERAANDVMFVCVSRCLQGPLVLDL